MPDPRETCACGSTADVPDDGTCTICGRYVSAAEEVCAYSGHEWLEAGGALLICGNCHAEKWEDARV
jgi:hypothetical protein